MMRLEEIKEKKAIIFDLDGTLLDSMGVWYRIDVDFLARRGYKAPEDYQLAIAHMKNREIADYTIKRFHLQEEPEALMAEWLDMAGQAYRDTIPAKPYVTEFVEQCAKNGVRMAVATSSDRELVLPALERTGLLSKMRGVVTAQDVSRGKGFPDIYLKALELLEAAPEDCVVFEDILEGIKGAKIGCFLTVGVYDAAAEPHRKEIIEQADYYIRSFEELL